MLSYAFNNGQKLLWSKNVNFRLGDLSPKGGLSPQWTKTLYRDPKGAHCSERSVATPAAVVEKREFEKNFSAL